MKNLYEEITSRIKLDRMDTRININRGLRQGNPLSPKLFIAVLQHLVKNLQWSTKGLNINGEYLSHLRFADDIILVSESPAQLNNMINGLNETSIMVCRDRMNLDKTNPHHLYTIQMFVSSGALS